MLRDNVEGLLGPGDLKRFAQRLALMLLLCLGFDHLKSTLLENVERLGHSFRTELRGALCCRKCFNHVLLRCFVRVYLEGKI